MTRPVSQYYVPRSPFTPRLLLGTLSQAGYRQDIEIVCRPMCGISDDRIIKYSKPRRGGRATGQNVPSSKLQVFRQSAAKVTPEVVPDERKYEADTASDGEQSGPVQSRSELWEERQNGRRTAADTAR